MNTLVHYYSTQEEAKLDNIVFSIGITALAGALATVAGAAEDVESDIGSQGDPNSQVQTRTADGLHS